MEKRLVDANELKSCIGSFAGRITDEGFLVNLQAVLNAIDFAPTVDPVKHGKWASIDTPMINGTKCSECGEYNWTTNYCPNCGAKMDGE